MIFPLFQRRTAPDTISILYGTIVAQARMPCFYRDYGVADSVNGRFDLIVLHLTLLFHRLATEPMQHRVLGQSVFDLFCRDMDHNLREMGVGDLAVPKKMQRIGAAFYGSLQAYEAALEAGTSEALARAVIRNIEGAPGDERLAAGRLAAYIVEAMRILAGQQYDALAAGELSFPDPESVHERGIVRA